MPSTAGVCGYKLPVAAAGYVSVGPALALLDLPPLPSTPLPLDVPVLEVMLLALPEFSMLPDVEMTWKSYILLLVDVVSVLYQLCVEGNFRNLFPVFAVCLQRVTYVHSAAGSSLSFPSMCLGRLSSFCSNLRHCLKFYKSF